VGRVGLIEYSNRVDQIWTADELLRTEDSCVVLDGNFTLQIVPKSLKKFSDDTRTGCYLRALKLKAKGLATLHNAIAR
jgi:hypothetical protein